jgi:hypothetical protein
LEAKSAQGNVISDINAELGDFLGFFLAVCEGVDICSPPSHVKASFDRVLNLWEDDPKLVVEEGDDLPNSAGASSDSSGSTNSLHVTSQPTTPLCKSDRVRTRGNPMTRGEFCRWAARPSNGGERRRDHMWDMIRLLQLRIFCMNFMLRMYGDSSDTYLAVHSPNAVYVRLL